MEQIHIEKYNELKKIDSDKAPIEILQKRGLEFEKLLNNIFANEGILLSKSYYTSDKQTEQIDGAIEVYNRVFLIEVKWVKSGIAASDLYAFIGKTENKFWGTLGIFISKEKLSENFLNSLNKGRRQSIIVIHGDDVELIFEHNLCLKDYIEFTFKQLAIDNKVCFPVDKYLEIIKTKKLEMPKVAPSLNKSVVGFIQNLLKQEVSANELQLLIMGQNQEDRDLTFNYITRNYSKVFYNILSNHTKIFVINNFDNYLQLYQNQDNENLISNAELYYAKLVETSLDIYSRDLFINLFSKHYSSIKQEERDKFEAFVLAKWEKSYGFYDTENQLTELIRPIWNDLKDITKQTLSKYYLDIYIRNTKGKFPQKSFANYLVNDNIINDTEIKIWLDGKIKDSIDAYNNELTEDRISFIAYTYLPIAKPLKIEYEEWVDYIKEKIKTLTDS